MKLRRRLKWWLAIIRNGVVRPMSGLAPRSAKRWVFGFSPAVFGGNPKYLFLWMTLYRPDIEVTWLTASAQTADMLVAHGYRAYRRNSLRGMIAALRAGVYVFAHGLRSVNVPLSRGAYLLNLWHGVGIKAIQWGHATGRAAQAKQEASSLLGRLYNLDFLIPPDAVVTTSDLMQAHFADQFGLPPARCPQLGYPRLDCAADRALSQAAREIDRHAGFELNVEGLAEIYIYMPTFRDTERPFLEQALPDFQRLSKILQARNALLYVKPHPRTAASLRIPYANIRLWPEAIDVNTYLADFTGLITDYSSVLYDYLYRRTTGIIVYTFDLNTYLSTDRTLLFPFAENVAGLRVTSFEALCDALRTGAAFDDALVEDAERIRQRFWGGSRDPASRAVVSFVERAWAERA